MKAVIMAGGKGTRIASAVSYVPKPMIDVLGKPVMQYGVECLVNNGITDITVVTGHLADAVESYFGDGSAFGASISYYRESEPLGTVGALYYLKDTLDDDFLLVNGDIIFDADIARFIDFHKSRAALATLFTHPNSHPYDSALVVTNNDGRITRWLNKEDERSDLLNRVNAGLHIMSPTLLEGLDGRKTDLDRDILKPTVCSGKLFAYDSPEYVFDVGTPERLEKVKKDIQRGIPTKKNLKNKQKAVFLDRDGTLNVLLPFIDDPNDLKLLDKAAEGLKIINDSGYLAVLATNQPIVARGQCTFAQLEKIHGRLETLLGEKGAFLDALYVCPHHPDSGFEGEVKELKIACECRKPKPGMLLEAAKRFNISLEGSFMVGDTELDLGAAVAAGCTPIQIGKTPLEGFESVARFDSVFDFAKERIQGNRL